MFTKTLALAALLATSALVSGAYAQAAFDKEKVCAEQKDQNLAALAAVKAASPDQAAMKALLAAAMKRVPGNGICLADLNGANNATGSVNQTIANLLGELADSGDIETAAGPEDGATQDFNTPAAPGATPEGDTPLNVTPPAASPSAPAAPAPAPILL